MKKIVLLVLVALFFTMPALSFAADDISAKVDDLQAQIDQLKKQNEKSAVGSKFPVDLYGFVAAQFFLGTARTLMYGNTTAGPTAAQSRVVDKTAAGGGRHTWFSATPQNSRVGLNWLGTKVSDTLKIGGTLELDFVNVLTQGSYGISPIPRVRLLFLELSSVNKWSLVAGQNWDIFSPLNTTTLSLGGNLWFQGNMGIRRPQARFTYNFISNDVNRLKVAVSANLPSNTDNMFGSNGITSGIPMGEGLVQYERKMKSGDLILAVSGVGGAINDSGTYRKEGGVAGSVAIPFHKYLKFAGEFQYGQNLGYLMTYANLAGNPYGARNTAFWAQITSQWCEKFDSAIGYGMDNIGSSKVAAGNVTRNQVAFVNFRYFPVKPFYFGIEYDHMHTNYKDNGASMANIIFSNFVYNF